MTNGEKIRSMTDEEIAELLDNLGTDCDMCSMHPSQCDYECYENKLKWLKQEVNNADN